MPVEPPATPWEFPPIDLVDEHGLVGIGADLEPGTVLAAYRAALFPMPVGPDGPMGWWSPSPRAIIPLDGLRVTRSLRQSTRTYEVRVDTAFDAVIVACADPSRSGRWISEEIVAAYTTLHEMGWVHSVEAWTRDGDLAGGLYGVAIGGLFAGESMFHNRRDASKVALVGLVERLRAGTDPDRRVLDVQWRTDHLGTLGAREIPQDEYLGRIRDALTLPLPPAFA